MVFGLGAGLGVVGAGRRVLVVAGEGVLNALAARAPFVEGGAVGLLEKGLSRLAVLALFPSLYGRLLALLVRVEGNPEVGRHTISPSSKRGMALRIFSFSASACLLPSSSSSSCATARTSSMVPATLIHETVLSAGLLSRYNLNGVSSVAPVLLEKRSVREKL